MGSRQTLEDRLTQLEDLVPVRLPGFQTPVDMTSTGATSLGIAPEGRSWSALAMVVRTDRDTSLLAAITVNIGTNPTNYDDIKSTTVLTGLTGPNLVRTFPFSVNGAIGVVAADAEVFVNVTVAGIGSGMMYVSVEGRHLP